MSTGRIGKHGADSPAVNWAAARIFKKLKYSPILSTQNWVTLEGNVNPIRPSKHLHKARNLVERFFNKIKYFRRIATRYDKLARNYLSGALIAATCAYWLN